MTSYRCDFSVDMHPVAEDDLHIVPANDVHRYIRAYAEMTADALSRLPGEDDVSRADAIPILVALGLAFQSDWAACGEHLRRWETYKARFPAATIN